MTMRVSAKAETFTESVIREMTRLSLQYGGVNLAQGFPDFACPPELKEAAKAAIDADLNQYAITWGARDFRAAIAGKVARTYPGWEVDPEREICVTCGSTEAMIATMLALVDPGEEVIVFEPYYENYGPDAILSGAVPRYVPLHTPDWSIDEAELRAAFSERTRAIIVNTPHNPTGKVFRRDELALIAELCQRYDALVVTDEIYEHIHYLGAGGHVPPATVPGLEDRTVTINALSKTYAVTGWRVGWTIAPAPYTAAIRKGTTSSRWVRPPRYRPPGSRPWVFRPRTTPTWPRPIASVATCSARCWTRPASPSPCPTARTTCCARPMRSTPPPTMLPSPAGSSSTSVWPPCRGRRSTPTGSSAPA